MKLGWPQRLAIIDLDDGNQPFCNEDRSIILVFNGEIFNAPELRSELQAKGVSFRSSHSSDAFGSYSTFI